jgi:hypothetical protein
MTSRYEVVETMQGWNVDADREGDRPPVKSKVCSNKVGSPSRWTAKMNESLLGARRLRTCEHGRSPESTGSVLILASTVG